MNDYQFDKQLNRYVPAIPAPFWYGSWKTFFRIRPACYRCGNPMIFKNRAAWDAHWVLTHCENTKEQP